MLEHRPLGGARFGALNAKQSAMRNQLQEAEKKLAERTYLKAQLEKKTPDELANLVLTQPTDSDTYQLAEQEVRNRTYQHQGEEGQASRAAEFLGAFRKAMGAGTKALAFPRQLLERLIDTAFRKQNGKPVYAHSSPERYDKAMFPPDLEQKYLEGLLEANRSTEFLVSILDQSLQNQLPSQYGDKAKKRLLALVDDARNTPVYTYRRWDDWYPDEFSHYEDRSSQMAKSIIDKLEKMTSVAPDDLFEPLMKQVGVNIDSKSKL